MKTALRAFIVLFVATGCPGTSCLGQDVGGERPPVFAGQFYLAGAAELRSQVGQLFAEAAPSKGIPNIRALIVPHAAYGYSGRVAASGFNQIDPNAGYENVFVIGSSHRVAFDGAAVYTKGNFRTPLGVVTVNRALGTKLLKSDPVFVTRDDAHETEHSLEVQLPFLQVRMPKGVTIVPIVLGTDDPRVCRRIAGVLAPYFTPKNLFVISSDFSHYPPYDRAKAVDKATEEAIVSNNPDGLLRTLAANEGKGIPNLATSLCGWTSVLTLLNLTHGHPEYEYTPVEYRNSGDTPSGDRNRVVGYWAIVVSQTDAPQQGFRLSGSDKEDLLRIARATVKEYVTARRIPEMDDSKLSGAEKTPCGAFVTLRKHGDLRGCIGRFDATEPLYKVVQQMAVASSTQDSRFSPVQPAEVKELEIEISVLTPMKKISSIDEIVLGKHGIYIRKGGRTGTFLPQVAMETGWSKEEFLGHCARDKAGLGWNGWKDAEIFTYEALVFSESDVH